MAIEVGAQAPEFTLKDQNNQEVSLSSFRGEKNVLLVFYPLAFTGVCQGELCAVRDDLPTFENDNTAILAISVGASPTHKIWSAEQGYTFPLLSDFWPHGEVAQAYGVFNEKLASPTAAHSSSTRTASCDSPRRTSRRAPP